MKRIISEIEQLNEAATALIEHHKTARVFALYGEMGAGKTTFIKELCSVLKSSNLVSSPTFTLVNEYEAENENPIYHFDLYRLKSASEALNIGIEEYLYSGYYCFIEWPEMIESFLPQDAIVVKLTVDEKTKSRTLEF